MICPAAILAVSRNARVTGRTNSLIVSVRIRNGARNAGLPLGSRAAILAKGA